MQQSVTEGVKASLLGLYPGKLVEYQPVAGDVALQAITIDSADFRENRGNWPKVFHRGRATQKSLVLVHGLTDSPFWLEAIGRQFAVRQSDLSVILPLLPGHGRKSPSRQMAESRFQDWREVVDQSVVIARMLGDEVSLGGFSTGGALCVDKTLRTPELVDGKILLFSAALDLSDINKLFIGTHLADWVEAVKQGKTENNGCGGDQVKYSRMFMAGAKQLEFLIAEIRRTADADRGFACFPHKSRTFVAHSEADEVIDVAAVLPIVDADDLDQHFICPRALGVSHSSLVLDRDRDYTPRYADERPPPKANPRFAEMTARALAFLQRSSEPT